MTDILPSRASPPPQAEEDTQYLADAQGVEVEEEAGAAPADDYGAEAYQRESVIEQDVEYKVEAEQPDDEEYYEE